jgi:hypothetical protein
LSAGLWSHLPVLSLISLYFLAFETFLNGSHHTVGYRIDSLVIGIIKSYGIYLYALCALAVFWLAFTRSRWQSIRTGWRWVSRQSWGEILLLRIPLALIIVALSGHFYLNFKVNIPEFAPYSWDHFFADVDRAMFLGTDPWIISHWAFPGLAGTMIMNNVYLLWYLLLKGGTFAAGALPMRSELRLTFLLAHALNAALSGTVIAILLPAAGPVYMERLTGDPTFAPLMETLYLHATQIKVLSLNAQELLWDGLTKPEIDPLGISAFPSLHVQFAATFACAGFILNRYLGWALWIFTVAVLIASVHLGWHYAIDGIVGIALAVIFWRISARIAGWWLARTDPAVAEPSRPQVIAAE